MLRFYSFSLLVLIVYGAYSWKITTTHDSTDNSFYLICATDVKLVQCVARIYDHKYNSTHVHNLTQGQGSMQYNVTEVNGARRYTGRYIGTGLKAGQCGIQLSRVDMDRSLVSCHVKAEQGGWQSKTVAHAPDFIKTSHGLITTRGAIIEPEVTSVAVPGGDLTFQYFTYFTMRQCYFNMPPPGRLNGSLIQTPYNLQFSSDITYWYDLPRIGSLTGCRFTLLKVAEANTGPYWCAGFDINWKYKWKPSIVFIPKLLTRTPDLVWTSSTSYKVGQVIAATCHARNTRPVARIEWLIGTKVIRSDDMDDRERPVFSWSWQDQHLTQHLVYRLRLDDNNKDLICRATVMESSMQSRIRIRFPELLTLPPALALTSPTSYKAGDNITATCNVSYARPVVRITWQIGKKIIRNDTMDDANVEVLAESWTNQNVTQHISYKLEPEDNNKELICMATVSESTTRSRINVSFSARTPSVCGERRQSRQLIAGGHRASPGEFPWHAALYMLIDGQFTFQCGASLVSVTRVITAAHCFPDIHRGVVDNLDQYRIALGKHHLNYSYHEPESQIKNISRVKLPLAYNPDLYANDIAVIHLDTAAILTTRVQLVCLDLNNDFGHLQLTEGSNGTVAGWGLTENGTQSDALKWVDLPWIDAITCRDAIPTDRLVYFSHDIFCAGHYRAGVSVCQGDSGGGLMFYNQTTNRYYLRGVVSSSFGARKDKLCFSKLYTAFTSLSSHLSFIKDNLN